MPLDVDDCESAVRIAKRQQDCCLPVTVVVRSEAGLLRASGSSRAACESVVPEQPVTALFYSSL